MLKENMKKIFFILINVMVMSILLALSFYFILKLFYKSVSANEKQYYNVSFLDCLAISFFYTSCITIIYSLLFFMLHRVLNFGRFKYLFGVLTAFAFIILFKLQGGLYLYDNMVKVEIILVSLFGLVITKMIYRYFPQ